MAQAEQYFAAEPQSKDVRKTLHVTLRGNEADVEVSNGVFSGNRVDLGTSVLLRQAPEPPEEGTFLDLGCGWGPIALALGFASPKADIWALDVNERALELTGLTELRRASVLTLSGGELQRTFLAQVFAQNPQILILDEPANHLDLIYQKHIFSLIETWLRQPGRAVVSVVHDLSLARKYGTHAVLMHRGQCAAQGKIGDVMTAEKLQAVYEMDVYGWMREMLGQWA